MAGTVLLLNHVQSGYLDPNNPEDVALRQKIYEYVEKARPHVDRVVWAYASQTTPLGTSFSLAGERPPAWREGDIEVLNNNGKGDEPEFLRTMHDLKPDHVILAGVYFEACSNRTATTIKQNFGAKVSTPMDLTNAPAPDPESKTFYLRVKSEMAAKGIDVDTSSGKILDAIKTPTKATILTFPEIINIGEPKTMETTNSRTKNGQPLEHFRSIQQTFFQYAFGNDPKEKSPASRLPSELFNEVSAFCETLRTAMVEHTNSDPNAVTTFKNAMRMRSGLLSDPRVTRNGELSDLLKNIVAQDERGRPEKSLALTRQVHSDALDPNYEGEKPEPASTEPPGAIHHFEAS